MGGRVVVLYGKTGLSTVFRVCQNPLLGKTVDKNLKKCNTGNTMVKRNTAVVSISLPQDILAQLNQWAKIERKSKTALIREALLRYRRWKFKRDWSELRREGEKIRKEFGLKTEQDLYDYIHGD